MARAANLHRQKLRPDEPTDLDFTLNDDHIPDGFLQGDVKAGNRRHLIFASSTKLAKAKTWYIDVTFKLCKKPFSQLLSINAFIDKEECAKQVPLVFVLMSGQKKKYYRKVLRKILDVLPTDPSVKEIVLDFEAALWSVLPTIFENAKLLGCAFHWTQAVMPCSVMHHTAVTKKLPTHKLLNLN